MTATLEVKVGPRGYIHGWVFVGAPGVGAVVHHPQHGEGRVARVVGNHVHVTFTGGAEHSFERAIGTGSPRLTRRPGSAGAKDGPDLGTHTEMEVGPHEVRPGDKVSTHDMWATVLKGPEKARDMFGRDMVQFRAQRPDTGKAGNLMYGPAAKVTIRRPHGPQVTADVPMMQHRIGQIRANLGVHKPKDRTLDVAAAALHDEISAPGFDPATADLRSIGQKLAAIEQAAKNRRTSAEMVSTIGSLRDEIEAMAESRGEFATLNPEPLADATPSSGSVHAAAARALASDIRNSPDRGFASNAADQLDLAAGHLDAGRHAEGIRALQTAGKTMGTHRVRMDSDRARGFQERITALQNAAVADYRQQAAGAGQVTAGNRAHATALAHARQAHFRESTGMTIPSERELRVTHSAAEYREARDHLLAGRPAEADAALGRAVSAEEAGRNRRGAAQLTEFRGQVQKAAADVKPVLPTLVKFGGNDDGSLRTVDHAGREYAVRLDKTGAVHVTHGGRTLRAAGGTTPTTIARELAGRLVGEELPKPVKPKKLTDAQMRKMPAVTAEGRQLDLYHAEGNEHLDRAARALAEGRNADAANHLTAAEWTAGGLTDRERIARQRAELAGKPPKLAKGETRVVAEGDHQGVHWQATERNEGFTNVRGYRLTYGGQESRSLTGGQGPHAAAEEFRQHVDAQPAKRAAGEEARRRGIDESNRIMLGRDRQRRENNPLDNMQIERAYEAAHGRAAPQSMRQRWAYDGSNAQDRASDWYKAGVSAKADRGDLTRIGGGGVLAQSSAGRDIRAGDRVRTIRRARAAGPFADESGGEGVVRGVHEGHLIIGTGDKRQLISARPEDVEHAEAAGPDRERVMLQPEHPGGSVADDVARTADAIDTAAPGADPQRALAVQASLRQAAASLRAGNHREAFTHLSDAGLNNIPLGHDSPAVTTRDGTPAASAVQRHMTSVLAMGGTPGTGSLHSETHAGARGREFRIEETGKGTHKITANGRYVGQGRTLESARQLLAKRASGAAAVESAAKSQKAHSALADQIDESANQISLEQSHSAAGPIKAAMRRAAAALRNGDSYQAGKELADAHQRYMFAAQRGAGRGGAGIRTAGTTEHGVVGARFAPEEITKHLRALNK